jgi:hypothetical protein
MKQALEASKGNATSNSALQRPSGVGDETRTSRDFPQLHVSQKKVKSFPNQTAL